MKQEDSDSESLKRLLVLLLMKLGATSDELGAALGMHPGSVRKAYPFGKAEPAEVKIVEG